MVNSNILNEHKGTAIVTLSNIDYVSRRTRKFTFSFPSVPSVAIYTLLIINYLGFDEVYLVGQDLAFIEGRYYAEGVNEHQGSKKQKSTKFVENNKGEMVETNEMLYAFLQSFNNLVDTLDKEKIKIFNLSRNGAKIKGVPYIPSTSILLNNPRKQIDLKLNAKKTSAEGIEDTYKIITEFNDLLNAIQKAKRKLKHIDEDMISIKEIKTVYKIFKEIRSHSIFEEVVIHRFSFMINKINNLFNYSLEKDTYSREDLKIMVMEISKLVDVMEKFLKSILEDDRIKAIKS